jgi:hypothetical protein
LNSAPLILRSRGVEDRCVKDINGFDERDDSLAESLIDDDEFGVRIILVSGFLFVVGFVRSIRRSLTSQYAAQCNNN